MKALWNAIQAAFGWVFPIFSKAGKFAVSSQVRWAIHAVLVVLVLVALGYLNRTYLESFLPTAHPLVRRAWLPLLFLLLYALIWLIWWLFQVLAPEEESAQFPDIDADWAEVQEALAQADVALTQAPLFLVLGETEGGEEVFFRAAASATPPVFTLLKFGPRRSNAAVRVYVSREAVFVTCPGASLLGKHAKTLNALPASMADEPIAPAGLGGGGGSGDDDDQGVMFGTIGGAVLANLLGGEDPAIATVFKAAGHRVGEGGGAVTKMRASILQNVQESERLTARLKYLAKLIARDRTPRCPINGILLLVPTAGSNTDADANNTGLVIQRDLTTLSEAFRIRCPLLTVVCDLERLSGFREFVKRFPAAHRNNRLGQRHPWIPDISPQQLPEAIKDEMDWICQGLMVYWTYKLFGADAKPDDPRLDPIKANADLFNFLCQMRERQNRLTRIVTNFVRPLGDGPLGDIMYGGCYLAGTGASAADQGFLPGVVHKLIESQDFVAWNQTKLDEDAQYRAWTTYGYAGIAALVVGVAALSWVLTRK
ncbi:MAG: hypothetical protein JNM56_24035 [Planctomycetia bacterium]|nr:hypothetical protein [Planctomycetia bacterium]